MKAMLFSPQMSARVFEGAKDVTRRLVALPTTAEWNLFGEVIICPDKSEEGKFVWECLGPGKARVAIRSPYEPGQRCFVAEEHFRFGHWEPVAGVRTKGGRQKWAFVADDGSVRFPGDPDCPTDFSAGIPPESRRKTPGWHKRLARFMPAELARAEVEIVSVRPERPCEPIFDTDRGIDGKTFPVREFQWLWESIHGPDAWTRNDWVWRIEFTLHRRAGR